jgi:hypothetical protein
MGALPAPGLQYAAGEDSDDPDAAEGAVAAAASAPDMGQVCGSLIVFNVCYCCYRGLGMSGTAVCC